MREQLLVEGARAQQELRDQLVEGVSFDLSHGYTFDDSGETSDRDSSRHDSRFHLVYCYPSMTRELWSDWSGKHAGKVKCANESYAFSLERRVPSTQWFVKGIGTQDAKAFLLQNRYHGLSELTLRELLVHDWLPVLDIEGIPIERFFSEPGVRIDSIVEDGDERIAVAFRADVATPTGPDRVLDGTIWFSPDKLWAVDEYDAGFSTSRGKGEALKSGNGRVRQVVEWTSVDGLPVPTSITTTYQGIPGLSLPGVEHRRDYSNWERRRYPTERFLMSHYGLPEPGLAASAPSRRWKFLVWINAVGLLLIAIGLGIRFRRKSSSIDEERTVGGPIAAMNRNRTASRLLLGTGVLTLAIGQSLYWRAPRGGAKNLVASEMDSEGAAGDGGQALEPHFVAEKVESQPIPGGEHGKMLVRVLMANRLKVPITILGGTSGCTSWGCWSVAMDGPQLIAPAQRDWLEIEAKWINSPERPLPVRLFTDLSLTAVVHLDVLPESVSVRMSNPQAP